MSTANAASNNSTKIFEGCEIVDGCLLLEDSVVLPRERLRQVEFTKELFSITTKLMPSHEPDRGYNFRFTKFPQLKDKKEQKRILLAFCRFLGNPPPSGADSGSPLSRISSS